MNSIIDSCACCTRCGMLYMDDNRHITTINGKNVDLCPECQAKLDKFMKMEEEDVQRCE